MSIKTRKAKMENVTEKTPAEALFEENQRRILEGKRSVKIEKLTIEKICEQEAVSLLNKHNAIFKFDFINYDIKTVFIQECKESTVRVTHGMISALRERISKVNKQYTVGIITTRLSSKADDTIELSDADIQFINETENPSSAV